VVVIVVELTMVAVVFSCLDPSIAILPFLSPMSVGHPYLSN